MIKPATTLTDKEIVEARIAILSPLVNNASRGGLESDKVLETAERHWEFAIKPILEREAKGQSRKSTPAS